MKNNLIFKKSYEHKNNKVLVQHYKYSNEDKFIIYSFINKNKVKKTITSDFILDYNYVAISKNIFNKIINQYYKEVKEEWEFEGEIYKNLDLLTSEDEYLKLPLHVYNGLNVRMVYHQSHVFFSYIHHSGKLFLISTSNGSKWTSVKNVAPIFNKNTKQII